MIKTFELENFRSFKNLKLEGLPTVNILVGQSAAGKTALLEGIRLGLGATPTLAWVLNTTRGVNLGLPGNPTREQFEGVFQSYFHDFNLANPIRFRAIDSEDREATLEMRFDPERPVTPVPSNTPYAPSMTNTIIPLAFERKSFAGETSRLDATIHQQQHGGQIFLQQGPELGIVCEFFSSTWQSNASQVANWFSQLKIANRSSDIISVVHRQFPDVSELSTETPYGASALYARMKHHLELMPVALISSGINKFVSLLIAIRTYRNGVVVMDEIENGIYYKMFPAFWEAIYKSAMDNQTQLFVSTHSWECLSGASKVIDKHPNDFSLVQVSHASGESSAIVVSGDRAAAAIEADIEVRK